MSSLVLGRRIAFQLPVLTWPDEVDWQLIERTGDWELRTERHLTLYHLGRPAKFREEVERELCIEVGSFNYELLSLIERLGADSATNYRVTARSLRVLTQPDRSYLVLEVDPGPEVRLLRNRVEEQLTDLLSHLGLANPRVFLESSKSVAMISPWLPHVTIASRETPTREQSWPASGPLDLGSLRPWA